MEPYIVKHSCGHKVSRNYSTSRTIAELEKMPCDFCLGKEYIQKSQIRFLPDFPIAEPDEHSECDFVMTWRNIG